MLIKCHLDITVINHSFDLLAHLDRSENYIVLVYASNPELDTDGNVVRLGCHLDADWVIRVKQELQ